MANTMVCYQCQGTTIIKDVPMDPGGTTPKLSGDGGKNMPCQACRSTGVQTGFCPF
jgi:hypothetical protein